MKKEKTNKTEPVCDDCQSTFEANIDNLVNEVEGYSKSDHDKKRRELNDAFKKEE